MQLLAIKQIQLVFNFNSMQFQRQLIQIQFNTNFENPQASKQQDCRISYTADLAMDYFEYSKSG